MTPSDPTTAPAIKMDGLPEGVEVYRFAVAGENDFELVGNVIWKGVRPGAASGVLVRPAKGWTFQPSKYADIKSFTLLDGPAGTFMAVKQQASTPITITVKVVVNNAFDQSIVDGACQAMKGLPGFVSLERS